MRIFLLGFYGYDNIGDEVLLASILDALRSSDVEFKVLSYNAKKTEQAHAVTAVSRGKNFGVIKQIANSDVIVVGGGSILQDITSSKSFFYYMSILLIGKLLGKRIYLLGNGFGPINRWYNRRLLKWFIPSIDGVVARDAESFQAYRDYHCKRLYQGVDCAFDYRRAPTDVVNQPPYVAIALRPWPNSAAIRMVLEQYIPHLNKLGYAVKLVAMKAPEDSAEMASLTQIGRNTELVQHGINEVLTALKGAKLLIGMRLHALILAALLGTPFVAVSYDPKINSFIKQLLDRPALSVDLIDYQALDNQVMQILNNYQAEQEKLLTAVERNRRNAAQQIDVIKDWMVQSDGRTS